MKKITLILVALLAFQFTQSQELVKRDTIYPEEEQKGVEESKPVESQKAQSQTLFGDQQSYGGYFGLSMGYMSIDKQDAFTTALRFMFVANHYLGIGFGGKGFMTMPETYFDTRYSYNSTYIANVGGYGGIYIEPVILSLKPIHASIPVLFGAGGLVNEIYSNEYSTGISSTSSFFIVEPGLDVEFNIAKWFRLGLGATYRFTTKLESMDNQPGDMLEGFSYNLTFKFGWF